MEKATLFDLSFAEEREEYKKTTEELLKQLAESADDRILAVDQMLQAEELRASAEEDLRAQIAVANESKDRYFEEWKKRKAVEEELARCKAELEKAKKLLAEVHHKIDKAKMDA